MTPLLETDRLWLRPLTVADAPAVQKYFDNVNIIGRLSKRVPYPYPEDGALVFLRDVVVPAMQAGTAYGWGIVRKDGPDEVVGLIEQRLGDVDQGSRGFWLAEPFWGRGYMTEAVMRTQDYLLLEVGLERMVLLNSEDNLASRRIKEKTGAVRIGTAILEHHHGSDVCEKWELTREQWLAYRAKHRGRPLS